MTSSLNNAKQADSTTPYDIVWFIPNLIGYGRVVCTIAAFLMMVLGSPSSEEKEETETIASYYWLIAIVLYVSSFVGDLFDGWAARKFDQCSTFGGLLDMITDRCSTLGLLYVLGCECSERHASAASATTSSSFPYHKLEQTTYLFLILLDISSHWCQMYSALSTNQHHKSKESNGDRNILVRWYYEHYYFFGYLCVGAEFTYILVYIQSKVGTMTTIPSVLGAWFSFAITVGLWICLPGCIMKQVINVFQLTSACYAVAQHDANLRNQRDQVVRKSR